MAFPVPRRPEQRGSHGAIAQRTSGDHVHISPGIDRAFGLNGNVVEIQHLNGSLTVDTRVSRVTLSNPVRIGGRRGINTTDIVIKYLPDGQELSSEAALALEREAHAYRRARRGRDPLSDLMIPATVARVRHSSGRNVPVIAMPFVAGTMSLRAGLREGVFTADHAESIQADVLDRTVAAIDRHRVSSQFMRGRMELVSMKRLERDKIWADMERAIVAVEQFFDGQIPEGRLRTAELSFAQTNSQTGETEWISYGSLDQMQQRISEFLARSPTLMAEGVDHDPSPKNAEVFVTDPPRHVRIDKGYAARQRGALKRLAMARGEAIDAAEAIFVGSKFVSLETLDRAGEVSVRFEENPAGDRIFIDTRAVGFSSVALDLEARMRSRWPGYAQKLKYPTLVEDLEMWEAMSDFYEFVYAGKRVKDVTIIESTHERIERSRPDTGLLMLQRMGAALARHDNLEQERESISPKPRRRASSKLQAVAVAV